MLNLRLLYQPFIIYISVKLYNNVMTNRTTKPDTVNSNIFDNLQSVT